MANREQGSKNYSMGCWPRTAVFKKSKSKLTPTANKNETDRNSLGSGRNMVNVEGKTNSVCITPNRVHKQSLSNEQERWGHMPVINLKGLNNFLP